MKFGDFLNNLASKTGQQNDPALIDILSKAELANVEIKDDFARTMDTNLMSLEGAKNNPTVLNHFKPIILKAIDDKYSVMAEKYGIADEIGAEKSTYKKLDILEQRFESKLAEFEKKGKDGASTKEIEKLTAQLQELQNKLAVANDESERKIADINSKYQQEQLDMLINYQLSDKNYANKQLDKEVNVLTAKTLLQNKLRDAKAIVINENGVLKLKQAENPTMDYVDAGYKTVSFADFTNKLLADNKLLEVSDGGTAKQQNPAPGITITTPGAPMNSKLAADIAAAQLDLKH